MTESFDGANAPLIQTKVRVPRRPDLLSRPRLLAGLRKYLQRQKAVLVCAGPGYGKTSLLVDFAHCSETPVCWYMLDPSDREPRRFLDYLVEAVRVHFPPFGESTRTLLRQGGAADVRGVIGLLVNDLAGLPTDVAIVLDEYHTVEDEPRVNQTLALLLDYLPDNVHLVVATRGLPSLPVIHLAAHREIAAVGQDQLRFTPREVHALLRSLGLRLSAARMDLLADRCEGWITGILLGVQVVWQQLLGLPSQAKEPADRVYSYLTQEVLSHLPSEMQSFLRQACILTRMEAALCDRLLDRADSYRVLEWLESRNLFLVALEDGWYRFHGLFRESLLHEARKHWESFVHLNLRAARLWRERGEPAESIEHLLQAQAFDQAAGEIENDAPAYLERGHWQTALRWIEALPRSVLEEHPRVLGQLAWLYMRVGKQDEATLILTQAAGLLAQQGDRKGWAHVMAARATQLRMQGQYQEALQTAQQALPAAAETKAASLADLYRTIAICCYARGDLSAAEENLRAAVQGSSGPPSYPYNQAMALQDLALCLRAQGRMQEGEEAYRKALDLWRTIGDPGPLANIINNVAMVPFRRGNFREAHDLLQQALEHARNSLSPFYQALVLASLGDLYRDQGDFTTALKTYQEGLAFARRDRNVSLIAYILEALGNLARRQGFFSEATRYLQESAAVAGPSRSAQIRLQVSQALLETARGYPEEAQVLLQGILAATEQGGDYLPLLQIHLAQAVTWLRLRDEGKAWEELAQAATMAEDTGTIQPFLAEPELLRPLLRRRPPGESPVLQEIRRRLVARPHWQAPSHLPEGQPLLRLLAFGPGRVFRADQEIFLSRRRGGARELIFYLYFHAPVGREQIFLEFWPDRPKIEATRAFHLAIHRIRQALGISLSLYQEGVYHWNPQVTCWCDVAEFERLIDQAESLPPEDPQVPMLLGRATSLFREDFLVDLDADWCNNRRQELQERLMQSLLTAGEAYLQQGDFPRAQESFERARQADPFREEAYRGLMRCHLAAGERARIIAVYQECCRVLQNELQADPSEETQSLYRSLIAPRI